MPNRHSSMRYPDGPWTRWTRCSHSAIPDSTPERRWVVYNGYAEGSTVPPGWHGWIHHRVNDPPDREDYKPREWEKPHNPNLTGTPLAYHPPGSIAGSKRPLPPK